MGGRILQKSYRKHVYFKDYVDFIDNVDEDDYSCYHFYGKVWLRNYIVVV